MIIVIIASGIGFLLLLYKIFQSSSEGQTNVPEHLREFLKFSEDIQRFPKIAEDFRGRPKDVSMIHQ